VDQCCEALSLRAFLLYCAKRIIPQSLALFLSTQHSLLITA
jgi:hypothetical protein